LSIFPQETDEEESFEKKKTISSFLYQQYFFSIIELVTLGNLEEEKNNLRFLTCKQN